MLAARYRHYVYCWVYSTGERRKVIFKIEAKRREEMCPKIKQSRGRGKEKGKPLEFCFRRNGPFTLVLTIYLVNRFASLICRAGGPYSYFRPFNWLIGLDHWIHVESGSRFARCAVHIFRSFINILHLSENARSCRRDVIRGIQLQEMCLLWSWLCK